MNFEQALNSFVDILQRKTNEHFKTNLPNLIPCKISIDPGGKKYIRIVRTYQEKVYEVQGDKLVNTGRVRDGQRMVWGFVQVDNGDILKSDGWKRPAKTARGNIYSEDPWKGMSVNGPHYLTGPTYLVNP